jgi:excisionase family DNA binding protein
MTDPIFVEVKEAARILALSTRAIYELLDQQVIESRYKGRKRLVVFSSLREYAESLPTSAPRPKAS